MTQAWVSKNDEFCIKNEEIVKTEELCIKNEEFGKMMNFAARGWRECIGEAAVAKGIWEHHENFHVGAAVAHASQLWLVLAAGALRISYYFGRFFATFFTKTGAF